MCKSSLKLFFITHVVICISSAPANDIYIRDDNVKISGKRNFFDTRPLSLYGRSAFFVALGLRLVLQSLVLRLKSGVTAHSFIGNDYFSALIHK